LYRERNKIQKYLDVAGVMFVQIDTEGKVTLVNKKGCDILGYDASEVIGKNWFSGFLPEGNRKAVKEVFFKLVSGEIESVEYFENPIINRNGEERIIAWRNTVLRDEQGRIVGTLSSGEDITERKKAEKKLMAYQNDLRSLASKLTTAEEFQRRQIAADLHDNVSQALSLSMNQLRRLRKPMSPVDREVLDEVYKTIEKVIQNVQDLTFDLASPTLYKIGLEAAISELLNEQLRNRYGITCKFSDDKKSKPLDDNIRVLLYRAVRELLVNVIKHAQASKVGVDIRRKNDNIQITVSDDGVGFDTGEVESSLRRRGGFGLFNIQERIDYVGGSFEIYSQPGRSSRFILTAPMKTKTN
jgi:PAS domain S-box-containing protein